MAIRVFPIAGPGAVTWSDTYAVGRHEGEDLFAARGQAVVAVDDGRARRDEDPLGGHVVYLKANDGESYYYAHLDSFDVPEGGEDVLAGETIGYVGDTGNATGRGYHLHFAAHPTGTRATRNPAADLRAAGAPSERPAFIAPEPGKTAPTTAPPVTSALLAKAMLIAWDIKHPLQAAPDPGITIAIAQALAEGTLDPRYKGTNNVGSMHATSSWARAHDAPGWGMVAFLDSSDQGHYITRMMVHPTLVMGCIAYLELTERNVDLKNVTSVDDFSLQQYIGGYFTMGHGPRTPLKDRKAAAANDTLNDADKANVREYASGVTRQFGNARDAIAKSRTEPGNPTLVSVGPPFATLAERLTSSAPRTIEHARQLLGKNADTPPPGAIRLAECYDAPDGEGVWLFGVPHKKAEPPQPPKPASASSSSSAGAWAALALVAALLGGGVVVAAKSDEPRRAAA